jgi:hypothetical protein
VLYDRAHGGHAGAAGGAAGAAVGTGHKAKGGLSYYYLVDAFPDAAYVVHFDLDGFLWSAPGYSWVAAAIALLKGNPTLVVVAPPKPGMRERTVKAVNFSRPLDKAPLPLPPDMAVDVTCEVSISLVGRHYVVDVARYRTLGPRNDYTEQRCLGPNKRCDAPYPCGGHRGWELTLACAVCNSPHARQAQLADEARAWAQHAPTSLFGGNRTEAALALALARAGPRGTECAGAGARAEGARAKGARAEGASALAPLGLRDSFGPRACWAPLLGWGPPAAPPAKAAPAAKAAAHAKAAPASEAAAHAKAAAPAKVAQQ